MHDGTRVVRAGLPGVSQGEPFLPGPTFAAPYHLTGDPSTSAYTYGRYHNPTWTQFEQALSELEGEPAIVFGTTLSPNDILVLPSDSYYTARLLAGSYLTAHGIQVR